MNQSLKNTQAKILHEKWLRKNNCHPDQLKTKKKKSNRPKDFGVAKNYYANQSNNILDGVSVLPVRSIFEDIRNSNESPETLAAINEKKSRIGPAWSKGSLQYIPDKELMKTSGRKI